MRRIGLTELDSGFFRTSIRFRVTSLILDINYNQDRPRVGSDQPITGLHQSGWRWRL